MTIHYNPKKTNKIRKPKENEQKLEDTLEELMKDRPMGRRIRKPTKPRKEKFKKKLMKNK